MLNENKTHNNMLDSYQITFRITSKGFNLFTILLAEQKHDFTSYILSQPLLKY